MDSSNSLSVASWFDVDLKGDTQKILISFAQQREAYKRMLKDGSFCVCVCDKKNGRKKK